MHGPLTRTVAWLGSLLLAVVLPASGQERGPGEDWPLAGGDRSGTRHSRLTDISTDTVERLGGAWTTRLPGGVASRATPVVADGALFLTAGANVFRIDAGSGEIVWRWEPDDARRVPSWQGVALGGDRVFVGLRSGEVAALDQVTGQRLWTTPVGSDPPRSGESVTSAPLYANGTVFAGLANGDRGGQGRVVALDAATGAIRWTFFVVPRPGEPGHETWPQDSDHWELGGGGVWLVGAVDPDLGLVYFATGNPVPMFGGEIRGGDNLYTASVLALEVESGERRWHYQVVRHDVWDADVATPLLLYDHVETAGSEPRPALAAMRADGLLFRFDRETGEPLTAIEERPVPQDAYQRTAATQPFPTGVESLLPDCDYWRDRVPPPFELSCSSFTPPAIEDHTIVAPNVPVPWVRVTPMSYDPDRGLLFAQGRATVGRARRYADPWHANVYDNQLTLPEPFGILAAIDTRTGQIAWSHEVPDRLLGTSGPLSTAGGLVFRASPGGQVEAYDARTGTRAWTFRTSPVGTRLRPGPSVTYAVDDTQHLAVAMGPELWAFRLDGDLPPRGAPVLDPWEGYEPPEPAPTATTTIETSRLVESFGGLLGGRRYGFDEHWFTPIRVIVTAGATVQFVNNGREPHTIAARDGSWSTETLGPAMTGHVTLDVPGTILYHCTDHPWAIGQITVEP